MKGARKNEAVLIRFLYNVITLSLIPGPQPMQCSVVHLGLPMILITPGTIHSAPLRPLTSFGIPEQLSARHTPQ